MKDSGARFEGAELISERAGKQRKKCQTLCRKEGSTGKTLKNEEGSQDQRGTSINVGGR